jgi:hypothetical protein
MELQEILKAIKAKASEAKKMTGLNSRHFAFKNWHTTVLQLLRDLPSPYQPLVNDFKALTFEDTGYKRGRKFLPGPGNTRFLKDLEASVDILGKILKTAGTEEKEKSSQASPAGSEKTPPPPAGTGAKKASASGSRKKPAKKGSAPARKKKKS